MVSCSSEAVALTAFFPFLRLLAEGVLVGDFVREPFVEAFVPFLVAEVGVIFPSVELLSDPGAFAAASEIRLGRVEVAVCSMTFFVSPLAEERRSLFAGGAAATSATFALRFPGAIIKVKANERC